MKIVHSLGRGLSSGFAFAGAILACVGVMGCFKTPIRSGSNAVRTPAAPTATIAMRWSMPAVPAPGLGALPRVAEAG